MRARIFAEETRKWFLDGFHAALYVAAGIALVGAIVAVVTVRKIVHAEAHAIPEAA